MFMNYEFRKMWEEVVVAHIKVFYHNLPGGTEKTT
jgi:hypothetical protein